MIFIVLTILIIYFFKFIGTACGKYHRCSTMAIINAGDSDILKTEWSY